MVGKRKLFELRPMCVIARAALVSIGFLLAGPPLLGQTSVTEWSSIAHTTNAACGDGFLAKIVEQPGTMKLTFFFNGKRASDVSVKLSADGSGRIETSGIIGRVVYEISSGTGKRSIRSFQIGGTCHWSWIPT
jgi:hypothetical protein